MTTTWLLCVNSSARLLLSTFDWCAAVPSGTSDVVWQRRTCRSAREKLHFAARVDEFDVAATRERGAEHAADRYMLWLDVVRGTSRADAWAPQAHRIGADGQSLDAARRAFLRQLRVEAMLRHNRTHPPVLLDLDELDAFQAGKRTYVTYHRLAATVGDALVTGLNHEPMRARSPLLSQRLGYLTAANARLATLETAAILAFRRADPLAGETYPAW
ncbi:hypothetical protein ABZS66_61485 [Dactylosporangium sp. NPDC005572]|uniref:hypothetical protein n=1 Tax=Dactylosporangium sp. NPDC005572 TaxID=3156889 RepID=UPI0033ACA928